MNLSFHPVTLDDVDQLMAIENACHSHPWSQKTFSSCIDGRYFGEYAWYQHNIVGFYIGDYIAGESTLMDICVAPDAQGQGFGKKLLQQFLAQAKQRRAAKALLEVRAKNITAQMLYINAGFVQIGRRTGYYPAAIGHEDAIVMSLSLR